MFATDAVEQLHGFRLLLNTGCFGAEFQLQHLSLGGPGFFSSVGFGNRDFSFCQADRGVIGSFGFGQHLRRCRFLLGGCPLAFGGNDDFISMQFSSCFRSFRRFDLLDQRLLGCFFRQSDGHLLLSVRFHESFGILDLFLFFHDVAFDGHSFADYFLNILLFDFNDLLFFDLSQTDHSHAFRHLQIPITSHSLLLNGVGPFLVALSNQHLPLLVFFLDLQFFFRANPGGLSFQPFFFLNFCRFSVFARCNGGDFPLLFFDRFDALFFQFQNRFLSFHVLLLQRLFLFAGEKVFFDFFSRSQFSDLFDALGIKNIRRAKTIQRSLFQIVNGTVVQHIAVQICSDHFQDLFLELVSFCVQLNKFEVLANGLQRFREFRFEKFFQFFLL